MNPGPMAALRVAAAVGMVEIAGFAAGATGGVVAVSWGGTYDYGATEVPTNEVVQIAAGFHDSLFLLADGSLAASGVYWLEGNEFSDPPVTVPAGLTNLVAVAAGIDHCLGLRADGQVVAWDASGWLRVPADLTNVAAICASWGQNLALRADGTVAAWGRCGTNVPADLSNVVAIACSGCQSCAVKPDGSVVAWNASGADMPDPPDWSKVVAMSGGWNEVLGLTADGTIVGGLGYYPYEPVVPNLADVAAMSAPAGNAGDLHLALRVDGTVVVWGVYGGPLVLGGLTDVVAVASGGSHYLALVGEGPPFLGTRLVDRTAVRSSTAYFRVEATGAWPLSYQWQFNGTNLPGATNAVLRLANVQANQAGAYSVTVTNAAGAVTSEAALLTVPAVYITTSPTYQVAYVGGSATFDVNAQGSGLLAYQWRGNRRDLQGATNEVLVLTNVQAAQAGLYSVVVRDAFGSATSAVASLTLVPSIITAQPQDQVTFLGGPATFQVSAQASVPLSFQWMRNGLNLEGATDATLTLTHAALPQAGAYSVTISNSFGAVASSNAALSVLRVAAWGGPGQSLVPLTLSNPVARVAGDYDLLALKADGSVVAWGPLRPPPADLANVIAIAAGTTFDLALKADGTVADWNGLGYGGSYMPAGMTNVVAIADHHFHALALMADGTVAAWGANYAGDATVPPGLRDVVAIAAGDYHNLALRSDGTVVAWGDNTYGQTNVPAGLEDIVGIAAGDGHSVALEANGTVVAFGQNDYGQASVPPGLRDVVAVACGNFHSLALKADGTVVAWGYNLNVPPDLKNVVAIAGGDFFGLAVVGDRPPPQKAFLAISAPVGGGVSVSVPTQCGRVYRLEYESALSDTHWNALPLVPGNGDVRVLVDPAFAGAQRFYRVRRW